MSSAPIAAAHARVVDLARRVLAIEAEAVQALADRLDETFTRAVDLILASRGRVIVSGIGKTGHIGRKFAATLASTGTPAYFVHAAEAAHGDLGMITANDVLVAISYSGSSEELLKIVPLVKRQGARLIALTGNPDSPLAREADVHLNGAVREEACPLNLAPTFAPTAADRLDKPVRILSAVFLILIVAATIIKERAIIVDSFASVGPAALCFNLASLLVGYSIPRLLSLDQRQSIAIGMEIGIHNGTLAIAIATAPTLLNNSVMAIPPAIYSLIMFFTAAAFGVLVNRGRRDD
mgnify:CR=1 FL=1